MRGVYMDRVGKSGGVHECPDLGIAEGDTLVDPIHLVDLTIDLVLHHGPTPISPVRLQEELVFADGLGRIGSGYRRQHRGDAKALALATG
jgi:hypothetical protein